MTTRAWRIYGTEGHRQKESFCESTTFATLSGETVIIRNGDKTGTNEYAEIIITAEDADACERALHGQISDGAFENARVGLVEEIDVLWYALQRDPSDDWGDGTYDKAEAMKRLAEDDGINLIAVIDNRADNPVCVEEIWKEGKPEGKRYVVRDREAGNIIEYVGSIEEGETLIKEYEDEDRRDGNYSEDFYEVAEIEKEGL